MIIDCISDLHGEYPELDGGDLLIVAGDLTAMDTELQMHKAYNWMNDQKYKKVVFIAGNHDRNIDYIAGGGESVIYLQDSYTEFEGLKIWGAPWTPTFGNWYFMRRRGEEIKKKWDLIPDDIDILVTHGPPYGILDKVTISSRGDQYKHAGCEELRTCVERIQPRLHVFGHIHAGYGRMFLKCTPRDVLCVNASIMNEDYDAVNKPIRVVL